MTLHLADACIHTIATAERLREAEKSGSSLHATKQWVTAARLLAQAQRNSLRLPIVFADSRNCSRLRTAWK